MKPKNVIDEMDLYAFLGAIRLHGEWRFFYDQGSRVDWGLDFRHADTLVISERRATSEVFTKNNFNEYISVFDAELSRNQIRNTIKKIPLTFVVNFDYQTFIDNGEEETFWFPIRDLIPNSWRYIESEDPYLYVPEDVKILWFNKHLIANSTSLVEQVGIYPYTEIGAVKFNGAWRFFYEDRSMWLLNFGQVLQPGWLNDPIYGDWRKKLPSVDEKNAADYLEAMSDKEIVLDEIPRLIYISLELEPPRTPQVRYVIDFDNKLYVDKAYSEDQTRLNINPQQKFAPEHWICHQDNPYKYIPAELERLWKKE